MKVKGLVSVLVVGSLMLTVGCSQATSEKATEAPKVTKKLSVVGSTSVGPLMEEINAKYADKEKSVKVEIQQVGSSAGIKAATDGSADIGMSSRDLTKEEEAQGLKPTTIALDGIAIVVHPENPVADLTVEKVKKIFAGEIKNWKEVGGKDGAIVVVSREDGSGTRTAFEELVKLQKEVEKDGKKVKQSMLYEKALVAEGNGAVKSNVVGNPNAIGYISLGLVDSAIKATKIEGVAPSIDTVKDKTYKISRPFLVVTKGEPKPEAKALIDYILGTDGQKIVLDNHYITVK